MKNKLKWIVSLAVFITLALLALTGCVRTHTQYELGNIGIITISDAVENALSSCVVVEVTGYSGTVYYYSMGVAVSNNRIIVPRQTIPTNSLGGVATQYSYKGRFYNKEGIFDLEYERVYNTFTEEKGGDYGFNVLRVKDSTVNLRPVNFETNKDNSKDIVSLGELLFGVQINLPEDGRYSGEDGIYDGAWYGVPSEKIPTYEFIDIKSVSVASKSMQIGGHSMSGLPVGMDKATFTTQGYLNKSDYDTYMRNWNQSHGFNKITDNTGNDNYSLTNCVLFNNKGEFVGINYLRRVDSTENNNNAVIGIGYTCRSSNMKFVLEKLGVIK